MYVDCMQIADLKLYSTGITCRQVHSVLVTANHTGQPRHDRLTAQRSVTLGVFETFFWGAAHSHSFDNPRTLLSRRLSHITLMALVMTSE